MLDIRNEVVFDLDENYYRSNKEKVLLSYYKDKELVESLASVLKGYEIAKA